MIAHKINFIIENVLKAHVTVGAAGEQPFKADAKVMELLDRVEYDANRAKIFLEILHSGGKGTIFSERFSLFDKLSAWMFQM